MTHNIAASRLQSAYNSAVRKLLKVEFYHRDYFDLQGETARIEKHYTTVQNQALQDGVILPPCIAVNIASRMNRGDDRIVEIIWRPHEWRALDDEPNIQPEYVFRRNEKTRRWEHIESRDVDYRSRHRGWLWQTYRPDGQGNKIKLLGPR